MYLPTLVLGASAGGASCGVGSGAMGQKKCDQYHIYKYFYILLYFCTHLFYSFTNIKKIVLSALEHTQLYFFGCVFCVSHTLQNFNVQTFNCLTTSVYPSGLITKFQKVKPAENTKKQPIDVGPS